MKNFTLIFSTFFLSILFTVPGLCQNIRTINGYNNNEAHKEWGSVGVNQLIPGTIGFADGISAPAGPNRPNPRQISNSLFMQNTLANDPRGLSAYCWAWGQFIDHDITLVKDHPTESLEIAIPTGDPFFDPGASGSVKMGMKRNDYDPQSGTSYANPRKFPNHITAYIDASAVYGSDEERASWLRTYSFGKLKTSAGQLLPWNTTTGEYNAPIDPDAPEMAMPFPHVTKWFVAGDIRANENPFLVSMHTLFVREHNRLCDEIRLQKPNWSDEQIYQHARKLVGGQLQAIVYEEWLPTMGMHLAPYTGYNSEINAGIMNVFSAAAYRYGHTTINSILVRMDNGGNYITQGDILLRDAFFRPSATTSVGGIDPYLIGMATVTQQDFDCKLVDDLRNFLFGLPGAGGLDLAAININRGRERGLADYNTVRTDFGLEPLVDFSGISSDPLMNQTLEYVYGTVNNMDPWVGMLAENHMPDALFGKTAMTIIEKQFAALRDGDRFYYENDPVLSQEEKQWIKETTLAKVIRRNTPVTIIQDRIFMAQSLVSASHDPGKDQTIDFVIYPNPARDMIFLRIPSAVKQESTIYIHDLQGKMMLQREAYLSSGNNTLTLSLGADFIPGLYLVTIRAERGGLGNQRFYKQ